MDAEVLMVICLLMHVYPSISDIPGGLVPLPRASESQDDSQLSERLSHLHSTDQPGIAVRSCLTSRS